jgi:hypothetical protein
MYGHYEIIVKEGYKLIYPSGFLDGFVYIVNYSDIVATQAREMRKEFLLPALT